MVIFTNAELDALSAFIHRLETEPEYKKGLQAANPGVEYQQYGFTLRKFATIEHQQTMSQTRDRNHPDSYDSLFYIKPLGTATDYSKYKQQIAAARDSIQRLYSKPLTEFTVSQFVEAVPAMLELFLQHYAIVPKAGLYGMNKAPISYFHEGSSGEATTPTPSTIPTPPKPTPTPTPPPIQTPTSPAGPSSVDDMRNAVDPMK
ncbi:hypothetical protein [Spirosoma oryzicola]|uniref:hypothetical protein n=1 Tax=Spirosoma oryzicola TaxID=2898794 RepID=UPI001E4CB6C4|nr:hypothetical protein [Spirosoma oryzicola]UHG91779.1 hypothetical protein LQ777_02505 [Spirosoma oryzicola]